MIGSLKFLANVIRHLKTITEFWMKLQILCVNSNIFLRIGKINNLVHYVERAGPAMRGSPGKIFTLR